MATKLSLLEEYLTRQPSLQARMADRFSQRGGFFTFAGVNTLGRSGVTSIATGPLGIATATDGGANSYFVLNKFPFAQIGQIWLSVFSNQMTSGPNCIVGEVDNSPYFEDFLINSGAESYVSGSCEMAIRDYASNILRAHTGSIGINDGKIKTVVFFLESPTSYRCFVDGAEKSLTYSNAAPLSVLSGTMEYEQWMHARNLRGGGQYSSGALHRSYLYARLIGNIETARALSKNPWQIFEPEQIPLFKPVTTGSVTLAILEALHGHTGDNIAFSLDTFLSAQDASHAHSAENLTLEASTAISLILSEAFHGLSSDVISFITGSYLQVADALHGHSADSLALATTSFIAVADALHSHAADNLTLDTSNATPLTTQDSAHAHSADNTALTLDTWLAIVEAVHAHSADNVSIGSEELLAIADALHSHASDALVLSIPSAPGTCPTAAEIAAAILAAAQITPIYSDIRKVNNLSVNGSGTDGDPWGP